MLQSPQTTCATSSTDGYIEIRDELGQLWCEYHPEKRTIRRYRKHKGNGLLYTAEISIDKLIAGDPQPVALTRSASPK